MAGYSKLYVVGGLGGFKGADGVNPIKFLILIGDGNRQWLAPHYFDTSIRPIGRLERIVPAGPNHPGSLLDACIAFYPEHFQSCPSLDSVVSSLPEAEDCLDFSQEIRAAWASLREEARPLFADMNIWQADLRKDWRKRGMKTPANIDLPFFAYGLFRPGQLAFFQLQEFVSDVTEPSRVAGSLRLRDGLPIIDDKGSGFVQGALLTFLPAQATEAYDRITVMEPDKHYRWQEAQVGGTTANVLVGRSPGKGSVPCDNSVWNGWDDPLFTAALDVVGETLTSQEFDWDLKPLFRLQMAYLLLWSSIERYVSLRYHLGNKVSEKVAQLACEPAFAASLQERVTETRDVNRADRPSEKEVLDPTAPDKAIRYYYQVRSNITHRGKGVVKDYDLLRESLAELLPIFREVLKAAEGDARYDSG